MSPDSCEIPKYSGEAVASVKSTLEMLAERGGVEMKKRFALLDELKKTNLKEIGRDKLLEVYMEQLERVKGYNLKDTPSGSFSLMKALEIFAPVFGSDQDAWIKIKEKWDGISNNYPEGYDRRLIEEEVTDIMKSVGVTLESGNDKKSVKSLLIENPSQNQTDIYTPPPEQPRYGYNYPEIAKTISENSDKYESSQFTWFDREVVVINGLGLKELFDNLAYFYDGNKLTIKAYTGDYDGFTKLMGKSSLRSRLLPKYLFTDGNIEGAEIMNGNQGLKIGSGDITYIAWTAIEEESPFFIQSILKASGLKRILVENNHQGRFYLICKSIAPRGSWGK